MKTVVISQPMFFPWVGMLEQIRLADVYVHYDDVQFSKGSFTNRVQIRTPDGFKWMTVPVQIELGQTIREVKTDQRKDWRAKHLGFLEQTYRAAPFVDDMLGLVHSVYDQPLDNIADVSISSTEALCQYFELDRSREFLMSSEMNIGGRSSQRVLDIVKHLGGDVYVTGHGAKEYLDHDLFEAQHVQVRYIDYQKRPYPQLYEPFTPYVSALDLVANVGKDGKNVMISDAVYWKDFLNQ